MTMPIARSTTFPRTRNFLKPPSSLPAPWTTFDALTPMFLGIDDMTISSSIAIRHLLIPLRKQHIINNRAKMGGMVDSREAINNDVYYAEPCTPYHAKYVLERRA